MQVIVVEVVLVVQQVSLEILVGFLMVIFDVIVKCIGWVIIFDCCVLVIQDVLEIKGQFIVVQVVQLVLVGKKLELFEDVLGVLNIYVLGQFEKVIVMVK